MAHAKRKHHSTFVKRLSTFIQRFHLLIYFVFVASCLAIAVVMINKTLTESTAESYTSPINAGSIDQSTLERIQSLHQSSQQSAAPPLPAGRSNAFAE